MKAASACPRPCSTCPWRDENHGKLHLDGWYTKRNRKRLWAKLKLGEMMSCHKTDPSNPVPDGNEPVAEGTTPHECTGALILQQRELMLFQHGCADGQKAAETFKRYKEAGGTMTRFGLASLVERALFGGKLGGLAMARPNLNEKVSR